MSAGSRGEVRFATSERVVSLPTRRATIQLAQRVADAAKAGDLVVLAGDLGAGKTFFARAFARALGLPRSESVASPTFSIAHEFTARLSLVHADLYRLESDRDVTELGLDERRAQGAVLVVEWGEPFLSTLGGDALVITLDHEPSEPVDHQGAGSASRSVETTARRRARLRSTGPRGQALLEAASVG